MSHGVSSRLEFQTGLTGVIRAGGTRIRAFIVSNLCIASLQSYSHKDIWLVSLSDQFSKGHT